MDIITVVPSEVVQEVELAIGSWVEVSLLPASLRALAIESWDTMWKLHPTERARVMSQDEEVACHRWSQSYLNTPNRTMDMGASYMFSGRDEARIQTPLPPEFQPFLDYLQDYNQVVANWYAGGTDYIAPHADCTVGMGANARIAVVNLGPEGRTRKFVLRPKSHIKQNAHRVEIDLVHGTLIVMGGKTQDDFRHGVPQCVGAPDRLSLSFRRFARSPISTKKNPHITSAGKISTN
jgi:alkylated DNA repair dioxygenase AlkB